MKNEKTFAARIFQIVFGAVAVGISLSVGIFLFIDFRQALKAERSRYQGAAYAFAAAASDAVNHSDQRRALEVIRGIRNMPTVSYIAVFDANRNVVAEIGAGARLLTDDRGDLFALDTAIEVFADVVNGGRQVGSIVLRASADGLRERYLSAIKLALALGVLLVALTSILAKIQVARIIKPLQDLSGEFRDIGTRYDLKRRLMKTRNDEIGVLVDAFNDMFEHIDDRNRQLEKHKDELEETVQTRTAQLLLAKDEAEAANVAKSTFLATMSHEIRTPMNGMLVMAEMLSAAPLQPKHQRYAEIITRSGRNLLHLINDILDLSKIESGRIELEDVAFSLDAAIEDVATLFAERSREKGLSIGLYIAPDVPTQVIGDPTRLTQIVSNLVNNALKFTEAGGVLISAENAEEKDHIRITVEDSGIGIPLEQMNRIFERFAQADSSITRKFGGTGLGLSITKQLVELMGGTIKVDSTLDIGSRFIVKVPFKIDERASPYVVKRRIGVALIDDHNVSRLSIERALVARGIVVDPNEDADIALIHTDSIGPDARLPQIPTVLLRPFAATSLPAGADIQPVAEIALPFSRHAADRLCMALEQGDLRVLNQATDPVERQITSDLSHLKILVVDDVPVNREVLAEALSTFNIKCALAADGKEAVAQACSKTYDMIFMDCSMPGMDGFEATQLIRDHEGSRSLQPAKIIALTGHMMDRETGEWRKAGMDAFLAKPFNIDQLRGLFDRFGHCQVISPKLSVPRDGEELLSSATLEMFHTIKVATGSDIKSKVFALFCASAGEAYQTAVAEIINGGPESRRMIHALKSQCTSSGAAKAASICQLVETQLSSGASVQQHLMRDLEDAIDATVAAMSEELGLILADPVLLTTSH